MAETISEATVDITEEALALLGRHYRSTGVYLRQAFYNSQTGVLVAICSVSPSEQYTIQEITKVTGQQFFTCLTQMATVLVASLVKAGKFDGGDGFDYEYFAGLMERYELATMEYSIKHCQSVRKGEDFKLQLWVRKTRRTREGTGVIAFIDAGSPENILEGKLIFFAPAPNANGRAKENSPA